MRDGRRSASAYVANVQFKRAADGVFKLLEVNPRFPGTLPLTSAAGVDMPKLMVDELAGRKLPDGLMPFKEIMVVRYWTEHYFDPAGVEERSAARSDLAHPPWSKRLQCRPADSRSRRRAADGAGLGAGGAVARRVDRPPDLLIVSPFLRARATADPIQARWPATRCETWPIQELTYLSPARCRGTTAATRRPMVDAYWQRCDPDYCRRAGRRNPSALS